MSHRLILVPWLTIAAAAQDLQQQRSPEHTPFDLAAWMARENARGARPGDDEQCELLPVPRLEPLPAPPGDAALHAEIEAAIDELAQIEEPGQGYSPVWTGSRFLPIPGMESFETAGAGTGMPRVQLSDSDPMLRLERWGALALPHLLAHLDDARVTGLVVGHPGSFGRMWHLRSLSGNPFNAWERSALGNEVLTSDLLDFTDEDLEEYTATVGDLCYVALGQITNRNSYRVVQYQPSACFVLCSPTHDPELARMVRAIWSGADPRRQHFQSLLIDLHTLGRPLDGLRNGAATRLLYYYPDESEYLLAELVGRVPMDGTLAEYFAGEFLSAIAFTDREVVQYALLERLVELDLDREGQHPEYLVRSFFHDDGGFFEAETPAPDDPVRAKLEEILEAVPESGVGLRGRGYAWLSKVLEHAPEHAAEMFELFLAPGSVERLQSALLRLRKPPLQGEWALRLAARHLLDGRATTSFYVHERVDGGDPGPTSAIRVCDEAALTVAHLAPERYSFELGGDHPAQNARLVELIELLRRDGVRD